MNGLKYLSNSSRKNLGLSNAFYLNIQIINPLKFYINKKCRSTSKNIIRNSFMNMPKKYNNMNSSKYLITTITNFKSQKKIRKSFEVKKRNKNIYRIYSANSSKNYINEINKKNLNNINYASRYFNYFITPVIINQENKSIIKQENQSRKELLLKRVYQTKNNENKTKKIFKNENNEIYKNNKKEKINKNDKKTNIKKIKSTDKIILKRYKIEEKKIISNPKKIITKKIAINEKDKKDNKYEISKNESNKSKD